jgi:hypothetical protein
VIDLLQEFFFFSYCYCRYYCLQKLNYPDKYHIRLFIDWSVSEMYNRLNLYLCSYFGMDVHSAQLLILNYNYNNNFLIKNHQNDVPRMSNIQKKSTITW